MGSASFWIRNFQISFLENSKIGLYLFGFHFVILEPWNLGILDLRNFEALKLQNFETKEPFSIKGTPAPNFDEASQFIMLLGPTETLVNF